MSDLALYVFLGSLAIQYPAAAFVYFDSRRFDLEPMERYDVGVLMPAIGFVVLAYYLAKRRTFDRKL
ncbi:hypothetical protein [Halostagnicola bangensis]